MVLFFSLVSYAPVSDAAFLTATYEEMGIEDIEVLDLGSSPRPQPVTIEDMFRAVGAQVPETQPPPSETQTPPPETQLPPRDTRSPDRLTYSAEHVRAQQRAKRGRRGRGG
jgi:hypothetical protein